MNENDWVEGVNKKEVIKVFNEIVNNDWFKYVNKTIKEYEVEDKTYKINIPDLIELITSHSYISKDTLKHIQKDENLKCIFMALIKKHYSIEEMEKFLKENKEFLENM